MNFVKTSCACTSLYRSSGSSWIARLRERREGVREVMVCVMRRVWSLGGFGGEELVVEDEERSVGGMSSIVFAVLEDEMGWRCSEVGDGDL